MLSWGQKASSYCRTFTLVQPKTGSLSSDQKRLGLRTPGSMRKVEIIGWKWKELSKAREVPVKRPPSHRLNFRLPPQNRRSQAPVPRKMAWTSVAPPQGALLPVDRPVEGSPVTPLYLTVSPLYFGNEITSLFARIWATPAERWWCSWLIQVEGLVLGLPVDSLRDVEPCG